MIRNLALSLCGLLLPAWIWAQDAQTVRRPADYGWRAKELAERASQRKTPPPPKVLDYRSLNNYAREEGRKRPPEPIRYGTFQEGTKTRIGKVWVGGGSGGDRRPTKVRMPPIMSTAPVTEEN